MARALLHDLRRLLPAPAPAPAPAPVPARSHKITKQQVRLLLFKECDWRGRKLLFDSSTIETVPIDKNVKDYTKLPTGDQTPCIVEVADGIAYQYKGPAEDASALGEMMFGAVAMNYKGVSLKIHILNEPHRLMFTKVFGVPKMSPKEGKPSATSFNANPRTDAQDASPPLSVPTFRLEEGVSLSFSFDRGDSGFYGEHSPNSSVSSTHDYCAMFDAWEQDNVQGNLYHFQTPPGSRKVSISSNGSWQRRMYRSLSTRFDLDHQESNLLTVPSVISNRTSFESHIYSSSTGSGTCDSLSSGSSAGSPTQRRTKLGLALLITLTDNAEMEMLRYYAEHSPQLQALICRLRMTVMLSGVQRKEGPRFIATLVRATADAVTWLKDLLNGPRLSPVWLNLVTSQQRVQHRIAESLLTDLCSVLDVGDTKHTNFFISTLLTFVLTYHLGWVTTVSPYDVSHDLPASGLYEPSPYNALWAQLSDLCGSIGCPARSARTVIYGKRDKVFLNKLLTVLTYFIRCGDVRRNIYDGAKYPYGPISAFSVTSVPVSDTKKELSVKKLSSLRRTATRGKLVDLAESSDSLDLNFNKLTPNSDREGSTSALDKCSSHKCTATTAISPKVFTTDSVKSTHSDSSVIAENERNLKRLDEPMTSCLKRTPTVMHSLISSNSSDDSDLADEVTREPKSVVFVLGDDDRLVGLKNKSLGGKSVKKSYKILQNDMKTVRTENDETKQENAKSTCDTSGCDADTKSDRSSVSPSRCCGQQSQHSKPIKHSGFKFEFDKYPQIVTNYMKSKNLEILDRHYIGKPGNLKLDSFQFDPTFVPPIQEERCENCYQCQLIESTLQTPTNASEFLSDANEDHAREGRPALQYAKEEIVTEETESLDIFVPKTFVRKRKKNTVVVNLPDLVNLGEGLTEKAENKDTKQSCISIGEPRTKHLRIVDIEMPRTLTPILDTKEKLAGFPYSLFGGLTDHYVPDMILQGTVAALHEWEGDLRRDLELDAHINQTRDNPLQAVAVVADSDRWAVKVLGTAACGMSALVGAMLDALPHMRRARVPAHECLSFIESRLREICVMSKSLADLLMSTDFCDMSTLTRSLNIDVNDVPLLLAVATTHTPQLAYRYGVSYR